MKCGACFFLSKNILKACFYLFFSPTLFLIRFLDRWDFTQCLQVCGFAILVQTTEQRHFFSVFLVPFLEPVRANSFFPVFDAH